MRKILLTLLVIAAFAVTGCGGKQSGESMDGISKRIVVVEDLGGHYYIVADKESGYEYFASRSYSNAYVIGGNVLDENGKPVKMK